jgi:dienelactone hydrolase
LHGSSGAGPRDRVWAKWLTDQGVACLIVDSFSLRHVPETVTDQFRLPVWTGAFDALAALALLSTHPKIDPRRIGVMGFSRGGMSALQTALEPVRAAALPALGQIRFAGHAAFYPFCGARAVVGGEKSVSGAPVLFLLGQEDDYAPPAPCRAYARWFEKSGAPTRVIEYPRAPHGFDFPGRRARIESAVILAPECAGELELTGRTYRPDDPAKAFREWRPLGPAGNLVPAAQFPEFLNRCLRRGATVGGDKETGEAVRTDLLAWMREVGILK